MSCKDICELPELTYTGIGDAASGSRPAGRQKRIHTTSGGY